MKSVEDVFKLKKVDGKEKCNEVVNSAENYISKVKTKLPIMKIETLVEYARYLHLDDLIDSYRYKLLLGALRLHLLLYHDASEDLRSIIDRFFQE